MTAPSIDTKVAALDALAARLASELSVEGAGLAQLGDLADRRQRAVVGDILIASVDGVEANLREASEHAALLDALAGPNGRAMPDPAHPEEVQAMRDTDRELVGVFRAAGSALDCLAAVTIVALRLPVSIKRASAEALGGLTERAVEAEGDESFCWTRSAEAFEAARGAGEDGWYEWMLEMRNAVIHRARQLRVWLPRPSGHRPGATQLLVHSELPASRLMRYELHLRRSPWLADLDSLSSAGAVSDNWLIEPATGTVRGMLARLVAMVEEMGGSILETWEEVAAGSRRLAAPAQAWRLDPPSRRAREEAGFAGFDTSYPVPPPNAVIASPREAVRAEIAEALRREGLDPGEVEGP
jgi:hypothetical protein